MSALRWTFALLTIVSAALAAQTAYVPQRVFSSASRQFVDLETFLADAARADVLFAGEQAADPNTHRLEVALLEGLARRRGEIVLALDMFGRDVQEPLDHFQMGHMDEREFLESARASPRYVLDYKPLVDFAVGRNWPVIAANAPDALADAVAESGLDVLKARPESERNSFAHDVRCVAEGSEYQRFVSAGATSAGGARPSSSVQNAYAARCLREETMAESIAQSYMVGATGGKRPLVVSVNETSYTDFREGLVERTRRRLPDKRLLVLSVLPVATLDQLSPDADARRRADYLIYTIAAPVTAR